jgi:hypothetical protein
MIETRVHCICNSLAIASRTGLHETRCIGGSTILPFNAIAGCFTRKGLHRFTIDTMRGEAFIALDEVMACPVLGRLVAKLTDEAWPAAQVPNDRIDNAIIKADRPPRLRAARLSKRHAHASMARDDGEPSPASRRSVATFRHGVQWS